jgi:uncharacterized protein YjcR
VLGNTGGAPLGNKHALGNTGGAGVLGNTGGAPLGSKHALGNTGGAGRKKEKLENCDSGISILNSEQLFFFE